MSIKNMLEPLSKGPWQHHASLVVAQTATDDVEGTRASVSY